MAEFRCHHCGQVKIAKELVWRLEFVRVLIERPLPIVSGYRCAIHNRAVGGAPRSQHRLGTAADVPEGLVTVEQALMAGFRGIGSRGIWAVHLDVRPGRLARWRY